MPTRYSQDFHKEQINVILFLCHSTSSPLLRFVGSAFYGCQCNSCPTVWAAVIVTNQYFTHRCYYNIYETTNWKCLQDHAMGFWQTGMKCLKFKFLQNRTENDQLFHMSITLYYIYIHICDLFLSVSYMRAETLSYILCTSGAYLSIEYTTGAP